MPALNKVMVMGNLGADPEMRYTTNGAAVTTFSVAVNEQWNDQNGERRARTEWFSVVTWNKTAENCAQYLRKGSLVFVEGRLQTRSWDGQDGKKQYRTEVVGDRVNFIDTGERRGEPRPPVARGDADGDIDPDDLPFAFREPSDVSVCEHAPRVERWGV